MRQITIRGVGDKLHSMIKAGARRRGMSMNRYILLVLLEEVGLGGGQPGRDMEFDDLDHLAGTWTAAEYEQFELLLDSQRIADEELWQ